MRTPNSAGHMLDPTSRENMVHSERELCVRAVLWLKVFEWHFHATDAIVTCNDIQYKVPKLPMKRMMKEIMYHVTNRDQAYMFFTVDYINLAVGRQRRVNKRIQ